MARVEAIGDEPIVFTDNGRQILLPVDDIFFDGAAVGSKTEPSAPSSALGIWLKYLVAQGRLVAAATPAPDPAMVFTAVSPGVAGNDIVVTIRQNGATQVDIKVVETDVYDGLTLDRTSPNYLANVLGDGTAGFPGTRPGLVRVQPIAGTPPDPEEAVMDLAATAAPIEVLGPAPQAGATPNSFLLEARGPGSDERGSQVGQPKWTIEVSYPVQPAAARQTFTLKVVWTNTVTVGEADLAADPATSGSKLFPLAFAVTIAKPKDSASLTLPRPGSMTLRGGAEAAAATSAKAILVKA